MKYLPPPIAFHIMLFVGPKAIYLNKELITYIDTYKKEFVKTPLVVQYQLQRMKEKVNTGRAATYSVSSGCQSYRRGRTSIYVEKPRILLLRGNIPLGYLKKDNSVKYTKQLKDELIPASYLKYCSATSESYKVTYWEVEKVWINNRNRAKLYCCLFGCC